MCSTLHRCTTASRSTEDIMAEDAAAAFPEAEGYDEFVHSHHEVLQRLADLRSDQDTEALLRSNIKLLEESGHVARWMTLRDINDPALIDSGGATYVELQLRARQVFLLDAACDAANHHYRMKHGTDLATSVAEVQASAKEGIHMLFRALELPGDPMKVRRKLSEKVNEHLFLLKKRLIMHRAKKEQEQRVEEERRCAEARPATEAEVRVRKRTNVRFYFAVSALLALAATWVQSYLQT